MNNEYHKKFELKGERLASRVIDKNQKKRNLKEKRAGGHGEDGFVAVSTRKDKVDIGDKKGINDRIIEVPVLYRRLATRSGVEITLRKMPPQWS